MEGMGAGGVDGLPFWSSEDVFSDATTYSIPILSLNTKESVIISAVVPVHALGK